MKRVAIAFTSTALFRPITHLSTQATKTRLLSRRTITCATTFPSDTPTTDPGIDSIVSAARFDATFTDTPTSSVPLDLVPKSDWDDYLSKQSPNVHAWLEAMGSPPNHPTPIPSTDPEAPVARVVATLKPSSAPVWRAAAAFASLPKRFTYSLEDDAGISKTDLELAWALSMYTFTKYKKPDDNAMPTPVLARLTEKSSSERHDVDRAARATYMVRDMISTPAEDFGPANLEAAFTTLAAQHAAKSSSIVGSQLLRLGYPQVHCVGRAAAADRAPRLLELVWNERAPLTVTLVGKGVCYDTGGLSIKPTASMMTMKKDMGGAAHVLGLAHMIMDAGLDIKLRVLVPAVENAVDGISYRPGDVLTARNGKTTLNANSDAEGRLVLADALVAAAEEKPDLIIDCATLTGAQRVAMGPDIPSIFCDDDEVAEKLCSISKDVDDLVWRLPLHAPYRKMLDTPLADIKSCSPGGFGGAITAALYLKEFVEDCLWIHVDLMGYNTTSTPGRPEGGEAMGMRAMFEFLRQRYSTT